MLLFTRPVPAAYVLFPVVRDQPRYPSKCGAPLPSPPPSLHCCCCPPGLQPRPSCLFGILLETPKSWQSPLSLLSSYSETTLSRELALFMTVYSLSHFCIAHHIFSLPRDLLMIHNITPHFSKYLHMANISICLAFPLTYITLMYG